MCTKAKKRVPKNKRHEQPSSDATLSPLGSRKGLSLAGPKAMVEFTIGMKKLNECSSTMVKRI